MANGWARLGEALAGVTPAKQADIQAKTVNALAQRDINTARAKDALRKSRDLESLGSYFTDLGLENPDSLAGISRSGINLNTLTNGLGNMQEQRFRQGAVDAATGGDFGAANAQLIGVAPGPVELPKVTGGVLLSNRLIPGGGEMSLTPVGAGQIAADRARGDAALIRANRPPASRASGGSGAPKLSEVQKLRMKAELDALAPEMNALLNVIANESGATAGPGVRKLAEAREALADLQARQQAIFDRYENAAGSPGADSPPARPNEVNGVAVPAGSTADELGLLTAMNLEFDRTGQPRLTGDEVRSYRETGSVRRPAAADPVTAAEGAISNRLIDRFAESLGGYGGAPAPAPIPAAAAPVRRQARDKKTGELVTFELRNGQWQRVR